MNDTEHALGISASSVTSDADGAATLGATSSGPSDTPPLLIGVSLKNYLGFAETSRWLRGFREIAEEVAEEMVSFFVLPGDAFLLDARDTFAGSLVRFGPQNVSAWPAGPFTGDISAEALVEIGCQVGLIGHAERRRLHGEAREVLVQKIRRACEAGLEPVVCVGEEQKCSLEVALQRCSEVASPLLSAAPAGPLIIAYEPEWSIGIDHWAPGDHVRAIVRRLRFLATHLRPGQDTRIIYGGSVREGCAEDLLCPVAGVEGGNSAREDSPDGLFLGRCAHDLDRLAALVKEITGILGMSRAREEHTLTTPLRGSARRPMISREARSVAVLPSGGDQQPTFRRSGDLFTVIFGDRSARHAKRSGGRAPRGR